MKKSYDSMDFRPYRPASVIVVDLVKHSTRSKKEVSTIQNAMEEVFHDAVSRLGIEEIEFGYTGDGYVCTLTGDSSARVLDLINLAFPRLMSRFSPHNQLFRAGVDFGLIHLRKSTLTGNLVHFDAPGIVAARLESAAREGQILASQSLYLVFAHHYPKMFPNPMETIKTKDREIAAYEILPIDIEQVRGLLKEILFGPRASSDGMPQERNGILWVDDEPNMLELVKTMAQEAFPGFEIVCVGSADEALRVFKPGQFAIVFTDIVMPYVSGIELTENLSTQDPEQIIVAASAYGGVDNISGFLSSGGSFYLMKPFTQSNLDFFAGLARSPISPLTIRNDLRLVSDNLERFLFQL